MLGWLAPLPTTPPQASLYPHAEIMHDSTVMVDIYYILYGMCMSGCEGEMCVWCGMKRAKRFQLLHVRHLAEGKRRGFGFRQQISLLGKHIPSFLQVELDHNFDG